ncbi:N-acyl-phosphatidylethanolamine-hydrolyzing phospholipase D-like [Schistocerca gregaria]|uniref:N-acyl-phosphatidylethanolamine-hydrolyzing phospholipase D-like n=1 Tax=Schistocerca gregaria TaxID=7010 RepID=UPI00211EFB27|nr:N-acyl-phosphatidylethanolamine-hydrolyzing phospholipase D-like [Schistocerca gregaria]
MILNMLKSMLSNFDMDPVVKLPAQKLAIIQHKPLEAPDLSKIRSLASPGENLDMAQFDGQRYVQPWKKTRKGIEFLDVFKLLIVSLGAKAPSKKEVSSMLSCKMNWQLIKSPPDSGGTQVTWMGHACFLIQIDNIKILTDPVWSKRCSPSKFLGPKRFCQAPCRIEELPPIDVVVISHNHYDHLDEYTIKKLGNAPIYVVPLGNGKTLRSMCVNAGRIVELDWWQECSITPKVSLVCLPAKHWSKRGLLDNNKALWSSWGILGSSVKVYFSGDSGYCSAFKSIGEKLGPFDLALIGIGAYSPDSLREFHMSPEDSVMVHLDVKSKKSIAMHWGTWKLSLEHVFDPPRELKRQLKMRMLDPDSFISIRCGETQQVLGAIQDQEEEEVLLESNT